MKLIDDDDQVVVEEPKKSTDDFDSFLSQYTTAPKFDKQEPVVEEPKKGRGRHPKGCTCSKCLARDAAKNVGGKQSGEPIKSVILSGILFITLIDIFLPLVISLIHGLLSKKPLPMEKLQLTDEQRNQLAPMGDAVVDYYKLNGNPAAVLFITMAGLYGMNYMLARNSIK